MVRLAALAAIAFMMVSGEAQALRVRNNPAWNLLDEIELQCIDRLLMQNGESVDALDMLGIAPNDKRILSIRLKCQALRNNIKRPLQKNDMPPWPKLPYSSDR